MVEGVVVPRPLVFGKGSRWYSGPSKTRGSTAVSLLLSVVVMTSPWRADDEAPEYMSSERWRLPPEGRGGPPSPICVVSRGLPILQRNWGPRRASGPRLGYALRMGSSHDAARGIRHDRLLEGDFRWGSTAADRDETHLGVGPQPELFVYVATNGSLGRGVTSGSSSVRIREDGSSPSRPWPGGESRRGARQLAARGRSARSLRHAVDGRSTSPDRRAPPARRGIRPWSKGNSPQGRARSIVAGAFA